MDVTPHFSLDEFRSHDDIAYPTDWIADRLTPLCVALERIREELGGRAVRVISGYRSPAHNLAVGGAKQSQHMAGRAADIAVEGVAPSDVYAVALRLFKAGAIEIGGAGVYPGWCHFDVRPRPADGHLAMWSGTKIGDEVA